MKLDGLYHLIDSSSINRLCECMNQTEMEKKLLKSDVNDESAVHIRKC